MIHTMSFSQLTHGHWESYKYEILLKSGYGHLTCDSLSTLIKEKAQLSLQNVPTKEYSFPQHPSGLRELHESCNHNESTKFNVAHLVNQVPFSDFHVMGIQVVCVNGIQY